MLKFVVVFASIALSVAQDASIAVEVKPPVAGGAPVQAGGAPVDGSVKPSARGPPPTPDPKQCKANYLKEAQACGNVPKLIEEETFKKCMKKPPGMEGQWDKKAKKQRNGGVGSSEEEGAAGARSTKGKGKRQGGDDEDGERKWGPEGAEGRRQGDAPAAEDVPSEKMSRRAGKQRRTKREPHGPGGREGREGREGPGGKGPGCFNCMIECVFNSSQFLDASNNVDIAAVKTSFVKKAAGNAVWGDLISSTVDSCWNDAKNAPAPTPAPGATAPPADKPQCKHQPLLFMQCVQRKLIIETPAAEKNATVPDCDARAEHLKNCDPMMPGFMDWKLMGKNGKYGGGPPGAEKAAKSSKTKKAKGRKAKKGILQNRRKKKATTVVA